MDSRTSGAMRMLAISGTVRSSLSLDTRPTAMRGPQITALQSRTAQCLLGRASGRREVIISFPSVPSSDTTQRTGDRSAQLSGSGGSDKASSSSTSESHKGMPAMDTLLQAPALAVSLTGPCMRSSQLLLAAPAPLAARGCWRKSGETRTLGGIWIPRRVQKHPSVPMVTTACRASPSRRPASVARTRRHLGPIGTGSLRPGRCSPMLVPRQPQVCQR
mmetsp:Transcript_80696/g.179296  ORF Transcript_80696/g.179296 Transcript_80696/m.179296 type:complete len:218 (-) Transcript_80696:202-855(-)